MDISQCTQLADRCRAIADEIESDLFQEMIQRANDAVRIIQRSFSGSWIGYHAHVYYLNFQPPPAGTHFSPEWGLKEAWPIDDTSGDWLEVPYEQVEAEFQRLTGDLDIAPLQKRANEVTRQFKQAQIQLVSFLDLALEETRSESIKELRDKAKELTPSFSAEKINRAYKSGKSYTSRDSLAVYQGLLTPHHVEIDSRYKSCEMAFRQMGELATIAETASNFLRQKFAPAKSGLLADGTIFIGHGRSSDWRELSTFLQDRLKLKWDEFNREPAAGISIKERLEGMLDQANFAFLIMTAEDEHADNTVHARENVIHEIGLFQGRLGFNRAIILFEEDCQEFSNIHGIGQLRYPKGYLKGVFEEVRSVLEREGILSN
uniref:Predicted nucleotide-binding protein containing TIR-like domain-containing protein n=1 Tax=Candidatus Kentrum sp. LPFa TaxID=2126335 RepID=A0A450VPI2_9GAMM|nr:MAG: Predicted nucleotide-binding protein containing TIR-like domain-containing protein [Candidatus Kentron sp. LPFa]VFK23372.1 MAG: Predicted nucleotide-binding protein containing TIR-like domain-containing protein [Candidatus Kentron sp. LPFa]